MTPYTLEESIQFLRDRLTLAKDGYKRYKQYYEDAMKHYDLEQAQKYHRWMMESNGLVIELEYIIGNVTGKERYNG